MLLGKLSVNIPQSELNDLREVANKRGWTMTETLRQAIALEKLVAEEVAKGNKILIQQPDRKAREILLP